MGPSFGYVRSRVMSAMTFLEPIISLTKTEIGVAD